MTRKLGSTGFRGVTRNGKGFRAEIYVDGKRMNIGTFGDAFEAAIAWDRVAFKLCGERSDINFPDEIHSSNSRT